MRRGIIRFPVVVATVLFASLVLCSHAFASIDDSQCIECHHEFDHAAYEESAHGRNACNSCHFDVVDAAGDRCAANTKCC